MVTPLGLTENRITVIVPPIFVNEVLMARDARSK